MRNDLFEILQDRSLTIDQRIEKFCAVCEVENIDYTPSQQAELLYSLEKLDDVRDELLAKLEKAENLTLPADEKIDIALEQLMVYFAFRHLTESLDDNRFAGRIGYVVFSAKVIRNLWALIYTEKGELTLSDMAEICRIYSAETEYSPDNMDILFDKFDKQ